MEKEPEVSEKGQFYPVLGYHRNKNLSGKIRTDEKHPRKGKENVFSEHRTGCQMESGGFDRIGIRSVRTNVRDTDSG